MDELYINKKVLEKYGISYLEFFLLFLHNEKRNFKDLYDSLNKKGLLLGVPPTCHITEKGNFTLIDIITDSKENIPKDKVEKLAEKLKEIFPKGKKPGTTQYWSEGKALIIRRLKLFFKKYGQIYSNETIIDATKRYVESFNGQYAYMRTLKYFIFKDVKGAEEVENTSDLITWIENKDEESQDNEWTSEIR